MKQSIKYPLKNKKILITCGPTWAAIDDVRVISNQSSGELGHKLADQFIKEQAKVTLLEGPVTNHFDNKSAKIIKFSFYGQLVKILKEALKTKYDIIIHAAAVSDYTVKKTAKTKLDSNLRNLTLTLVPTKKIISIFKRLSPKSTLVGFKLESKISPMIARQKSLNLFVNAGCDFVLANSSQGKSYKAFILDNSGEILAQAISRNAITQQLVNILKEKT